MVIFNSYVKLPEGRPSTKFPLIQDNTPLLSYTHFVIYSRRLGDKQNTKAAKKKIEPLPIGSMYAIYGHGSKLGTPKLWMVNTKLD